MKRLLLAALGIAISAISAGSTAASTMSSEHQITVTGIVPELRMVVVDERQTIKLLTSNTANNVAPQVHLLSQTGPVVPMTSEVRRQYERLMSQVTGEKVAVVAPAPAPLADLMPDFVSDKTAQLYQVTPVADRTGARPQPYWISAQ